MCSLNKYLLIACYVPGFISGAKNTRSPCTLSLQSSGKDKNYQVGEKPEEFQCY